MNTDALSLNLPADVKVSGQINLETTNYALFKLLVGNREIKDERVGAIIESIKKVGYQPSPILVNEKYEIIDGQGRFEAAKRLSLPVTFTVKEGIGLDECIAMNIKMKNWDICDFIGSYAAKGNKNYIQLLEIYEQYEENLTFLEVAMCLSNSMSKNVAKPLREGNFKIELGKENLDCIVFINNVAKTLKAIKGGSNYYIPILVGLYKMQLIDEERMTSAIEEHIGTMNSAYNADSAVTELQNVYNYRKHQIQYFRDIYLQKMRENGARYKL